MAHPTSKPDSAELHLVLDLETLAIAPNATITEIGIVDILTDERFSVLINPYEQQNQAGEIFKTDPQSAEWHLKRDPSYLVLLAHSGIRSTSAARLLHEFLMKRKEESGKDLVIWCQGIDFDIPIITNFLKFYGYQLPWKYADVRDIRTLAKLFPGVEYKKGNHTAAEDAFMAAQHLRKLACAFPAVEDMLGIKPVQ